MASASHDNKRKRSPSTRSMEHNSRTPDDRSETQVLKPFHVTHKAKNMESSLILTYMPDLPVNTQYFDLHELLTARKDEGAYWAKSLDTWRQVRFHVLAEQPSLIIVVDSTDSGALHQLLRASSRDYARPFGSPFTVCQTQCKYWVMKSSDKSLDQAVQRNYEQALHITKFVNMHSRKLGLADPTSSFLSRLLRRHWITSCLATWHVRDPG